MNLDTIRDAIVALYPPLNKKQKKNRHALGVESEVTAKEDALFVVLKGKIPTMRFRAELTVRIDAEAGLVIEPDLPVAQCHAQSLALRLAKVFALQTRPVSERKPDGRGFLTVLPLTAPTAADKAQTRANRIAAAQQVLRGRKRAQAPAATDPVAERAQRQAQRLARAKARRAGILKLVPEPADTDRKRGRVAPPTPPTDPKPAA